jgi:hypothetical protein
VTAPIIRQMGCPDAAVRYQAERDELSLRLFHVTERIASFGWTTDNIGDHLLELTRAMSEEITAMSGGHLGDHRRQPQPRHGRQPEPGHGRRLELGHGRQLGLGHGRQLELAPA